MAISPEVTQRYLIPALASLLDGGDIVPGRRCNERARPLIRACRRRTGEIIALKKPINRNDFLAAAFHLTQNEPIEHLLIGLGRKVGNTTKVEFVYHGVGSVDFVEVPEFVINAVTGHVESDFRAEALIFHNHPANPLHALFDHRPLASRQDRSFMLRLFERPKVGLMTIAGGGSIRFYLGENSFVREFRTPNLDEGAALIDRVINAGVRLLQSRPHRGTAQGT